VKIYLAGPMRGIPEFNFPAFTEATASLRRWGHEVASPHEKDIRVPGFDPKRPETLKALDPAETFQWDLQQVLDSQAVVLLPGWENSKGAQLERLVAESTGKKIFLYTPGHLIPASAWDHPLIIRW
jgi:uncharacterized protein DUF4406